MKDIKKATSMEGIYNEMMKTSKSFRESTPRSRETRVRRIHTLRMKKDKIEDKCWKKFSDEYGPSYINMKGDVLDVVSTYPRKPVTVSVTKKDASKVQNKIQYGTKTLYKGNLRGALLVAQKYMKENDCNR